MRSTVHSIRWLSVRANRATHCIFGRLLLEIPFFSEIGLLLVKVSSTFTLQVVVMFLVS